MFYYFLFLTSCFFWGGNFVVGRFIHTDISPISLSFFRWLICLIFLFFIAFKDFKKDFPIIKKHIKYIFFMALIGLSLYHSLVYYGLSLSFSANASLIQALVPMIIPILGYMIFKTKINLLQIISLVLAFLGVMILISKASLDNILNLQFTKGDLVLLFAAFLWSIYTLFLKKAPLISGLSLLFSIVLCTCFILFPFVILENILVENAILINQKTILSFLYLGIFPALVAHLCWNKATMVLGANVAGVMYFNLPIFGVVLSVIFLGERLFYYHYIAIVFLIFAIFLFVKEQQKINSKQAYKEHKQ